MTVPAECEQCRRAPGFGKDGRRLLQAHHHKGYLRPTDVVWLCTNCHRAETPVNPRRGEDAVNAKLNNVAVMHIREKVMNQRQYARLYQVSPRLIAQVQQRRGWSHIGLETK